MNNSRRIKIAALAIIILAMAWPTTTAAAADTGRAECLSMKSKILGKQVPYCTVLPPSYDTDKTRVFPILYFFHGLGDNEQSFVRSGGMNLTTDLWERHQLSEFLIVTPAAEASFYINSHDGHSRYEDFLLREFIPFIEHRYRIAGDRLERGVGGISMGGFGALRLAFVHPELFGSVTGQSAALIENAPQFVPDESQRSSRVDLLAAVFGSPPDRAFWDRNNPLKIARTANLGTLKIYFDCGSEDDFGFYTGAATLDKILTARHITHEFHIYPGRHDWTYFAAHLPAVLEFHAQSFAAAARPVK
jgi:S-formylglutathione hydrolase FrmB